ncbi:zinc finger protein castor homolog 1 isoform X7 [Sardina pilchardus]|uniref:zinc finger protein castor homolog 1 isoform X7 n=1 Tax=Sardina pilchardus TaxID=27697 RepID=UPI002E0F7142
MKVTCLRGFNFDFPEYAERTLCTEKTSGNPNMAAKRKGGLKLNAICAKLSRQVVTGECGSQNADGDASLADNSERGSSHYDESDRPDVDLLPEGLTLNQSLEEDQRRREAIEKWVNGEYGDESFDGGSGSGGPGPGGAEGPRGARANNGGEDGPPEGVYMVQPKGCSDDEDNGDEPDALHDDGSFHDDRDSEDGPHKEDSYASSGEVVNRQPPFTSPVGEASALRDYAANTMNELLNMFGYDDQQMREELAKKISFEKLKAATSDASSLSSEEASRRARFSKYEEYIRKLKAGETLPWTTHSPKPDELHPKLGQEKPSPCPPTSASLLAPSPGCLPGAEPQMYPAGVMDPKQTPLAAAVAAAAAAAAGQQQTPGGGGGPPGHVHPGTPSRASKYDFFIQKLKMGESLRQQNGSGGPGGGAGGSSGGGGGGYKRPSKYDLENVKFLHLFKPGEGSPDMGGAIAFKTGKVGRPSKYDIRNIPKLIPGKEGPPLMPSVLSATPGTPGTPLVPTAPAASVGGVGPTGLPGDQAAHLGFNTAADYLKSSFSKTDSITTGTMSSVKNGLPPEKPVTEDVNVYQKYIARSWENQQKLPLHPEPFTTPASFKRFSGSQHCGHVHCAYQYREHYHCMDPECNYQRFTSKQDVIRHYNMHKKRDNSLQHGFMRFSPLDDCSVYYHGCHLNGKSTHYHCMQVGCNKVYTSTSDVMTHENFHKKNAQLINDGFQRFRATEDCGTVSCQFYGQKTTHFHCRRPGCTFTFKNKCDIEKHKSYHIKDDAYAKDGFKKFYKYEECKYEGCVYSKATNHFHCIRSGCGFTFTSTSQMTSHKRKHERRHIRSGGMLGLGAGGQSAFLLPKEEQEESSNDDLMDFSAISSKNSSLSASPTAQQQQQGSSASGILGVGHSLMPPATSNSAAAVSGALSCALSGVLSAGGLVKSTASLPPASRMSSLLSQALPSNMPVALALSNPALAGANPFFPLMPRLPLQLPPSAASGLIAAAAAAASSGAHGLVSDSLAQSVANMGVDGSSGGCGASTPTSSYTTASIMEKISASKGLISPMMARLAAAALKPAGNLDAGNGLPAAANQFNLVHVKQEPVDGASGASQDSVQEHSLDLSKKDHRYGPWPVAHNESNGHPAPANTSLLSSLMNKMVNPGFFSALNLKTELENNQGADTSEVGQYLSRVMGRPMQEKPVELWRTYLRRFDTDDFCEAQCDFLHKVHFHCLVEDCGALFSTVDGAVKHANFHFRANLKVKSESPYSDGKEASEGHQSQLATSISMANTPPMDVPSLATSGGYSAAAPSLLAWKHLTGSIPQLPASMPNLPASSPLATTSLENAKPQVKPGFLQFQDNDPCLATDCKYSNKFHFHCLFGNCKYVCKTSGKAESHCLDHINPNNNLINVRDQFSYYSLQCLCPNQHCEFRMRGHYHCLRPGCFFVTNITTKLPWHVKKHEKAERRAANGFKYFTKREECGRLDDAPCPASGGAPADGQHGRGGHGRRPARPDRRLLQHDGRRRRLHGLHGGGKPAGALLRVLQSGPQLHQHPRGQREFAGRQHHLHPHGDGRQEALLDHRGHVALRQAPQDGLLAQDAGRGHDAGGLPALRPLRGLQGRRLPVLAQGHALPLHARELRLQVLRPHAHVQARAAPRPRGQPGAGRLQALQVLAQLPLRRLPVLGQQHALPLPALRLPLHRQHQGDGAPQAPRQAGRHQRRRLLPVQLQRGLRGGRLQVQAQVLALPLHVPRVQAHGGRHVADGLAQAQAREAGARRDARLRRHLLLLAQPRPGRTPGRRSWWWRRRRDGRAGGPGARRHALHVSRGARAGPPRPRGRHLSALGSSGQRVRAAAPPPPPPPPQQRRTGNQPGRLAQPGHRRQQLAVLPEERRRPRPQRLAGPQQEDGPP